MTAVGFVGCSRVTEYEFQATAVELPEPDREELAYEERNRTSWTSERSRTVRGVEIKASIESHVTVYDAREDDVTLPVIAVLSTPRASVGGRAMNPLVRRSLEDLLTSAAADQFLGRAGLDGVGGGADVAWERGPTFVGSQEGEFLGESVTVEGYAGLRGGDPRSVAFVHLVRAETDDVALAAAVHGRRVEETRDSFVGSDGYVSRAAFDDAVDSFADALERMAVAD